MTTTFKTKTTINNLYEVFRDFNGMISSYMLRNNVEDIELFSISINNLGKTHKMLFMAYLLANWNAYAMDIINGNYKHIGLTHIVYTSWLEYMVLNRQNR